MVPIEPRCMSSRCEAPFSVDCYHRIEVLLALLDCFLFTSCRTNFHYTTIAKALASLLYFERLNVTKKRATLNRWTSNISEAEKKDNSSVFSVYLEVSALLYSSLCSTHRNYSTLVNLPILRVT